MILKYIGEDTVFHNLIPDIKKELIKDKTYEVELQMDTPQTIINGIVIQPQDSTICVCFSDGVRIPYASNLLHNFWKDTNVTG